MKNTFITLLRGENVNKVVFRCAKEKDILFIRNFVRNSEAIWGFDEIFLGFWGLIVEEQGGSQAR